MPQSQYQIPNSTYGLHKDWSYKSELFWSVSLSWRCHVCILKIRIAKWKPKQDRSNQAIFYYDVTSDNEALAIMETYKDYDFKAIENLFEALWKRDNFDNKGYFNTGETSIWFRDIFLPLARAKFKPIMPWEQ